MNSIRSLLLIDSLDLGELIEQYRLFFLGLLPSVFILAIILEYFNKIEPLFLLKRALISILILTTITSIYHKSIDLSLNAADEMLNSQKHKNILLQDMLSSLKNWDKLNSSKKSFYKDSGAVSGTLSFLKYHLFDSFINDSFIVIVYFLSQLCFLILKLVYSLVYFLGYGLVGIPCLIYLFPNMGNILKGAIITFLWLLTLPHVLVFILSLIGSEINKGYISGEVIGGSIVGTALLLLMSLFIAFTPIITSMILNGSGISHAGGIIATLGANYVLSIPKSAGASSVGLIAGTGLGPKGAILGMAANGIAGIKNKVPPRVNRGSSSYSLALGDRSKNSLKNSSVKGNINSPNTEKGIEKNNHSSKRANLNNSTREGQPQIKSQSVVSSNSSRRISSGEVSKPNQNTKRYKKNVSNNSANRNTPPGSSSSRRGSYVDKPKK